VASTPVPATQLVVSRGARQLRAKYDAARDALLDARRADRTQLDYGKESPAVLELYDRAWKVIGEWTVAYLRRNPRPTPGSLAAAIAELNQTAGDGCVAKGDYELEGGPVFVECFVVSARVLRLGSDPDSAYAVALSFGWRGKLLFVSPSRDLVWKEVLPARVGTIVALPDDRRGRHRFYVDARPGDDFPLGSLACKEMTVWDWDGRQARELVRHNYTTFKSEGVRHRGEWLTMHTRGGIRTFYVSNQDRRLMATQRVRVTPNGVQDLGLRYDAPEYQLADELLHRTLHGEDVSLIATPDAARRTAALLAGVKRDEKCCGSLGELMESAIRRDGSSTTVELHLDRYHAGRLDLELTIGRPTGKARVTGVRAISATSSASR